MSVAAQQCPHALLFHEWDAALGDCGVAELGGHWLISSHALVRQVLLDVDTFAPDNALDAVTPMSVEALRILASHGFRLPHTLANNGTDTHAGLRAVVAEFLTPARVEEQRAFVTALVRDQVASVSGALDRGEEVDLHATLSHALPLVVLGRMVLLPDHALDVVKRFSAAALELFWAPLEPQRQVALAGIVGEYHAQLRAFACTGPGLAARLRAHASTHGLTEDDVVAVLFFLLVAGQETTSQFLTALLHRLLRNPEIRRGVAVRATDVRAVVAEALRLDTSVVTWRRITTRATNLGGVAIPAGASIVMRLSAAGRDAAVVEWPDEFVPGQRGSRRHLAFGAGVHRCLGAFLATMEAEVLVAETAALLNRCRVVRAPRYADNLSFRMPDALVVAAATT